MSGFFEGFWAKAALTGLPGKKIRETHDYSKKRQSGQTLAPQAGPSGGA
jgi:hypothetical protein